MPRGRSAVSLPKRTRVREGKDRVASARPTGTGNFPRREEMLKEKGPKLTGKGKGAKIAAVIESRRVAA